MGLSEELKERLVAEGASLVAFGNLNAIPERNRNGFDRGILIAVALPREIVRELDNGPTLGYYETYNRLNGILNRLGESAAAFLTERGYRALAKTTAVVTVDPSTRTTELPHKTVATRAGAGWIGKCALLVTKEFGPALRLTSVLTDAPLETEEPVDESACGSCSACLQTCPAGAVKGANWHLGMERSQLYDASACRDYASARCSELGVSADICGWCIAACPWTKRYLERDR